MSPFGICCLFACLFIAFAFRLPYRWTQLITLAAGHTACPRGDCQTITSYGVQPSRMDRQTPFFLVADFSFLLYHSSRFIHMNHVSLFSSFFFSLALRATCYRNAAAVDYDNRNLTRVFSDCPQIQSL
ncbi:hypothetical protein F5050DRAFT_1371681 [Lentinula boryana]|uniref:Secreted protein n=1 Tax=Lentinula boryana TaxID=40481 RepID=A0ABQ8QGN6_9AGAR|nr:hypothetical protein F5050DRAFT_1371681 [Lentinula boryana]